MPLPNLVPPAIIAVSEDLNSERIWAACQPRQVACHNMVNILWSITTGAHYETLWYWSISMGYILHTPPIQGLFMHVDILIYSLNITVTSHWARWCLKLPGHPLFAKLFVQAQIKENIKVPRHWALLGEFTGDRWTPLKREAVTRKMLPFDDVIMNVEDVSWRIAHFRHESFSDVKLMPPDSINGLQTINKIHSLWVPCDMVTDVRPVIEISFQVIILVSCLCKIWWPVWYPSLELCTSNGERGQTAGSVTMVTLIFIPVWLR